MTRESSTKNQSATSKWQQRWIDAMLLERPKQEPTAVSTEKGEGADDFLRAIVDACASNVAVLDETGTLLYASRAWTLVQFTKSSGFEHYRRFSESGFDEEAEITLRDDIQQILFGCEKEFHRKYFDRSATDQQLFVMHAARLNLPDSTFRVLMTREDLLAVSKTFRDSKERLMELMGATRIFAWEASVADLQFNYVSEQASKMLGYPIAAWYSANFLQSHVHPDDRPWVVNAFQKQSRNTQHFNLTYRMLAKDSSVVWVQNLVSVTEENGGTLNGFMIDVSEQKRAEEALKFLGGRLIVAQEEERKRVARELHDDFNQRLAILSIELAQLAQHNQVSVGVRRKLQRLQTQTQEISAEIHRLSYRLHPSKLDHLGLAAAVKSLCTELTDSGKLTVQYQQRGFPTVLDQDVTLCIFRIAQEGLRNCVKHSCAESAQVMLTKTNNAIRLSVWDNGCGFDTKSELMEKGLGFISMKERLHILGGDMHVYSNPLRGTRLEVSVPINSESRPSSQLDNTLGLLEEL